MLVNPRLNQKVQVWYAKSYCSTMPLHGKIGKIVTVGSGKPRNHGVEIGGKFYVVPCGNLNPAEVVNG